MLSNSDFLLFFSFNFELISVAASFNGGDNLFLSTTTEEDADKTLKLSVLLVKLAEVGRLKDDDPLWSTVFIISPSRSDIIVSFVSGMKMAYKTDVKIAQEPYIINGKLLIYQSPF
jgi:hypothetical protein